MEQRPNRNKPSTSPGERLLYWHLGKYPKAVQWAVPSLLVIGALVTQHFLRPVIGERSFLLLYPTVFFSALISGSLGPGVLASFIATIGAWYFFVPTIYSFTITRVGDLFGLVTFAFTGLSFSLISGKLRSIQGAESEVAQLSAIITSSDDAIISKTLNGTILTWNPGAEKIFGYSADEMQGKSIFSIIPADKHEEERRILDRLSRGSSLVQYETTRIRKDGTLVEIASTISPIKDEKGNVIGACKIGRDVTEKKATERNIQELLNTTSVINEVYARMRGEPTTKELAENVLTYLAHSLKAHVGAFYRVNEERLIRLAGFALPHETNIPFPEMFHRGQGLLGQAVKSGEPFILATIPENYLTIRSALGETKPASLLFVPIQHEGKVIAAIEFGTLSGFAEEHRVLVKNISEIIGVGLFSADTREQLKQLLEETRAQQDELQASNEELENTTNELQTQQEELKQANEELQEQRTALEEQKESLEKTNRKAEEARSEVQRKAEALETAGKYKSEFLANMSHELRTPLNSILLLSKAMSENLEGNLNSNQLESAHTIHSSGTDLLNLINDILDLSKVEAGKLEIRISDVEISELVVALKNQFRAQMEAKDLSFEIEIAELCPEEITTDRLRLEQILKNFLSNAIKFTEKGFVKVIFHAVPHDNSSIAITVKDTGIGIPEAQRSLIFEAFEQGDNSISRRYGGTGLGLTIARELGGLLGGEIQVHSEEGKGSEFTLVLPIHFDEGRTVTAISSRAPSVDVTPSEPAPAAKVRKNGSERVDDRRKIDKGDRVLLIIEDDPHFAKILLGLCRGRGFKCLLATNGEAGLTDADEFQPDAIILDLRLPAMSGMTVLGRLKKNLRTRHIPVHVMSVEEKRNEVLQMGAVGFLSKPADKERLEDALKRIETTISTKARSVLVVEDRKVEREAILKLIGNGDVTSVGAETGEEALQLLRTRVFDCMILDIKLPDFSGFDLLDKMEKDETLSRPAVIIYTGRDLTKDEIVRLNKFSQTIIIKGVKSEDRLFDEVALFLHRVVADLPESKQRTLERVRHREGLFEGKKILVVDDDMRNVFALRSLLQGRGFEIFAAKTGKEALRHLDEHSDVDIVLMDIMMPEMDGFEAMRKIRAQEKFMKLPIIALTAKAMVGDRDKCLEAGANDYLSKPIDGESLLSLLRVWLTRA